jgi:hypothetical protein
MGRTNMLYKIRSTYMTAAVYKEHIEGNNDHHQHIT